MAPDQETPTKPHHDKQEKNEKLTMSVAEAAELVGFPERTLRHLIDTGRGPLVIALARRNLRIKRADLLQWIDESREKSQTKRHK